MKILFLLFILALEILLTSCVEKKGSINASVSKQNSGNTENSVSNNDTAEAQAFADKATKLILENKSKDLRLLMEKEFVDSVSENAMEDTLKTMFSVYGRPLNVELKEINNGNRTNLSGETKQVLKFWYAIETTKHKKGKYFLTIEIVPKESLFSCASFSIVSFQGEIPSQLN